MLRSIKEILGYKLTATDDNIGSVHDMIFDDRTMAVRYIVADTGGWLSGRKVLLSPVSFGKPNWSKRAIPVSLTSGQIEKSPNIDVAQTVSRKHEADLHNYYGWPAYWTSMASSPGETGYAAATAPIITKQTPGSASETNLRSTKEVLGYHIQARDGEIGHVEDFVVDDDIWIIRYMVVDTRNWLPGRKVLVSPAWISAIRWDERKVHLDMEKETVKNSPEYDPFQPVNREYEARLYDYYGRPKYWQRSASGRQ